MLPNSPNSQSMEDEAVIIDLAQVWDGVKRHTKTIGASALVCALAASVYAYGGFFQSKYQSEARVLYNPQELATVVSAVETNSRFFKGTGALGNPYKNQEELLKSRKLATRVFDSMRKQKLHLPVKKADELIGKFLHANVVSGSDFIELSATASSPKVAMKLTEAYVENYLALTSELAEKPLMQQEKLFKNQLHQVESELKHLTQAIQEHQQQYGIIDISGENNSAIREQELLSREKKSLEAELAEKRAELAQVRKQLQLKKDDTIVALQSVADGQNTALHDLQKRLHDVEKDYAVKAKIFAPTNPDMQQLEEQIAVLRSQVADQQIMTVSHTGEKPMAVIRDSVRSNLVAKLANREAEVSALDRKLATVNHQYHNLREDLKTMPAHHLAFAQMKLEHKNKEDVLTQLRSKLAEIQIQQAAGHKKLQVVDPPSVPKRPAFPDKWHVIALAGLMGAALSAFGMTVYEATRQHTVRHHFIEAILGLPVLATLPWIGDRQWQANQRRGTLDVTASPGNQRVIKAYQNLALNLKVHKKQTGQNALTVSSLMQESEQSTILGNLAYCLAQSGESVALIDTRLRSPRLHEIFGHQLDYERGLTELINGISEVAVRQGNNPEAMVPLIHGALLPSGLHPQLHYLNAGVALSNTFEFLNSRGFACLVETLRIQYDWVLFDAPPFLTSPDASVLLSYTDGLLSLIEREANEGELQAVHHKVARLGSGIVGCVVREPEDRR